MTNLPGLPFLSVVSATIAAITAPTNPTPMTTTISLPSARAASTSDSRRLSSLAYSLGPGIGKLSPAGLTDTSAIIGSFPGGCAQPKRAGDSTEFGRMAGSLEGDFGAGEAGAIANCGLSIADSEETSRAY